MPPLDDTDAKIVGCLQENARISFKELGERVHLSTNAARDRVQVSSPEG